jgi:squalene synthase HpnC
VTPTGEPLGRAYAAAEALARSHYENFPVASWLLPAAMRPHVAAVYAFARVADDIADEGTAPAEDRLERLDAWKRRLHAAVAVEAAAEPAHAHEDLLIVAVAHSIRALELPLALFDDLISAFAQDTMTTRYDSWAQLLDYCRRSANPIGRLVLRIARVPARDDLLRASDAFCTALQLANFWQDLGRDWRAGRLYVPREAYERCGAREAELRVAAESGNGLLTENWHRALGECVRVTADLFAEGRSVCDAVTGRLRYELRFTWLGGTRILERVDATRAQLMTTRPALGAADVPSILWRAISWPVTPKPEGRRRSIHGA